VVVFACEIGSLAGKIWDLDSGELLEAAGGVVGGVNAVKLEKPRGFINKSAVERVESEARYSKP
jgi:hypothetical protein